MTRNTIHISNCPACGHFPTQHIGNSDGTTTYRAASLLGKKGGSVKSKAKSKASRENGKKGGRPKKS